MGSGLPVPKHAPFWTRRSFRMLLLIVIMGVSAIAVLVFEIAPQFRRDAAKPKPKPAQSPPPEEWIRDVRAPAGPRTVRFDGVLDKVKDGTSIDERGEAYNYLLQFLKRYEKNPADKPSQEVGYSYLAEMPDVLRGRMIRLRYTLFLRSDAFRLDDKPDGIGWVFRTYLMDVSGQEGYVVDLLERPPDLEPKALVEAEALFLKIATYEGMKGPVRTPLFLARAIRPVNEKRVNAGADTGTIIVGGAVLALVALVGLSYVTLRRSRPKPMNGPPVPPAR
jgi:hypothetical protein